MRENRPVSSQDEALNHGTDLHRRVLDLEGRLLDLEAAVRTQRRTVAPICMVTAGLVLGFASFGLIRGGTAGPHVDLLGGWAALFLVYVLVMVPLTGFAVASRSGVVRGIAIAAWAVVALMAVCMGAGPRGALTAALGVAPWYLLGATVITVLGLARLPAAD